MYLVILIINRNVNQCNVCGSKRRNLDNFTNYVVMMSLISNSDDKDTSKMSEKQEIWGWSAIYYGF